MDGFVSVVAQRAGDADTVVVAQITAHFSDNHRHGVSGEFYAHRRIEIVDGFDQSDTSDLKQVVHIFMMIGKTFDHA